MWFWQVPVFPLRVVSWAFWSRNVKSFWQKHRFGWAWARTTATDFSLEETHKKFFFNTCAFPSTMVTVMRVGNTSPFPCQFCVFMIFHEDTHVRCQFLWKHIPNAEISEHRVYRCGNTFLKHTRLQSLFCLCVETHRYVFICSGSLKSRKSCAFPCFLLETTGHTCVFHANLLSSSLKQQETPGWNPAVSLSAPARLLLLLCSQGFSVSLEQQNCPIIKNIGLDDKKPAIFANLFVSVSNISAIQCYISLSIDITLTWFVQAIHNYKYTTWFASQGTTLYIWYPGAWGKHTKRCGKPMGTPWENHIQMVGYSYFTGG